MMRRKKVLVKGEGGDSGRWRFWKVKREMLEGRLEKSPPQKNWGWRAGSPLGSDDMHEQKIGEERKINGVRYRDFKV